MGRLRITTLALGIVACGGATPATTTERASHPREEEVVELVATLFALSGTSDHDGRAALYAPGAAVFATEADGADGRTRRALPEVVRVHTCSELEVFADQDVFDVSVEVMSIHDDDSVRLGARRIRLEGPVGGLRIVRDEFLVRRSLRGRGSPARGRERSVPLCRPGAA